MKKLMLNVLALCLALTMTSLAKDAAKDAKNDAMGKEAKVTGYVTDPMCAKSGDKAKMADADCAKKCAKDGKWAFVNDKDGKVWDIQNPDAVKGHEGHHVTLTAHLDSANNSVHVTNVAMTPDKSMTKEMKSKKNDMHKDEMKSDKK